MPTFFLRPSPGAMDSLASQNPPKSRPKPRPQRFDCPCGCGRRSWFTQPRSLRPSKPS